MLNKIHIILLAITLTSECFLFISIRFVILFQTYSFCISNSKDALPAEPKQPQNTISSNEVDFTEDLPFEVEYYRTSTDQDEFDRPFPSVTGNSIEDDGIGIDSSNNEDESECTYEITVTILCDNEFCNSANGSVHVKNLDIQTRNLELRPDRLSNFSLNDFVRQARRKVIATIEKNDDYSNEMLNSVIGYIRNIFLKTYGYEDNCGISVALFSEFGTKKEIAKATDAKESLEPLHKRKDTDDAEVFGFETTEIDEGTTEQYQSRTLTRPKVNTIVQEAINVYRALNHWKYWTQA